MQRISGVEIVNARVAQELKWLKLPVPIPFLFQVPHFNEDIVDTRTFRLPIGLVSFPNNANRLSTAITTQNPLLRILFLLSSSLLVLAATLQHNLLLR